jgi:hypothetical protein
MNLKRIIRTLELQKEAHTKAAAAITRALAALGSKTTGGRTVSQATRAKIAKSQPGRVETS